MKKKLLILIWAHLSLLSDSKNSTKRLEDAEFWKREGMNHLKNVLNETEYEGFDLKRIKAKNVIIFIGDGMGMASITAGRIYKGQLKKESGEECSLVFDKFPHTGLAKTYSTDTQVADSASTGTAILCGSKTNSGFIGVDVTALPSSSNTGSLSSIMDWAQKEGKYTGIVTTTRITHATPAAAYAKVYNRNWECETEIPVESKIAYKDIARQLVEDSPGNNFNVILGGGLRPMGAPNKTEKNPHIESGVWEEVCDRKDSINLVQDWLTLAPTVMNRRRHFIRNREELMSLNIKNVSNVLGLFRNNHMNYALLRQPNEPSLSEMTQQAVRILRELSESNGHKGFVLLVEGGRIDHAHHNNYARAALREIVEFDEAIEIAQNITMPYDTLTLVTADHSHTLTINGYPKRGTDILGTTSGQGSSYPYETLSYANGPGFYNHRWGLNTTYQTEKPEEKRYDTWIPKEHLTDTQRKDPTYRHFASVPLEDETHGGEDVPVYGKGVGSVLVRGVFEQNYLAWLISYVGCFGPAKEMNHACDANETSASSANGNLTNISTKINSTERNRIHIKMFGREKSGKSNLRPAFFLVSFTVLISLLK